VPGCSDVRDGWLPILDRQHLERVLDASWRTATATGLIER
jgi:hypothetical protein